MICGFHVGICLLTISILLANVSIGGCQQNEPPISDDDALAFVTKLAFSPNGRYLAATSHISVSLWDIDSCKLLWRTKGETWDIAFSPDSKTILIAGRFSLRAIDVRGGQKLEISREWRSVHRGGDDYACTVSYSSDSSQIAMGTSLGYIWIYTMKGVRSLAKFEEIQKENDTIGTLLYTSDGKGIYAASSDGVTLRSSKTLKIEKTYIYGARGTVARLSLSSDGKYLTRLRLRPTRHVDGVARAA